MHIHRNNRLSFGCFNSTTTNFAAPPINTNFTIEFQTSSQSQYDQSMRCFLPENTQKQSQKVLKLIGNKQQNVEEIVSNFGCICGCKAELKKIVNLLMEKIYRLRKERNQLREELSFYTHTPRAAQPIKGSRDASTNTEELQQLVTLGQKLKSLAGEEDKKDKKAKDLSINSDQIQELFGINIQSHETQIQDLSDSNLLESSVTQQPIQSQPQQLSGVLQQKDSNCESRLRDCSKFAKKAHLNFKSLQNYIQKLTCARQLQKYDQNKRAKAFF